MYIVKHSDRVHMARMHELASFNFYYIPLKNHFTIDNPGEMMTMVDHGHHGF